MIGYNCKYAPVEIMAGFGENCVLMNNEADNFDYSSAMLHPNMCSHAKAMLEDIHIGSYNGIVLMNCCDSSRRVADSAVAENLDFSYFLDLPDCSAECAVERFKNELLRLIKKHENNSGKVFNVKSFLSAFQSGRKIPQNKFVAVLGARSSETLIKAAEKCFAGVDIYDMTCSSSREVAAFEADENEPLESIMQKYSRALLSQSPCMRMRNTDRRADLTENENCVGIIYSTVKFCDYYDFEYSKIKNTKLPVIRVETDYTNQSYGQLLTRIEGFAETVNKIKGEKKAVNLSGKYYAGIDSGSTSTELVVIDKSGKIINNVMVRTGANAASGAKKALEKSGVDLKDIVLTVATGYGRKNIDFADSDVTEITCHAKGAKHLFDSVETIIDIGGQDSKVIRLDENGKVSGFAMNDKCAAGTGRFLENMAKVLELDMSDMALKGLDYKKDLTISSMCTVFAESEVVSLIAQNYSVSDIVHGLNKSVAVKTRALVGNSVKKGSVMMTGGVANNKGVVTELEKIMNTKIFVPENPEFCGALGAALIAVEQTQGNMDL